MLLGTPVNYLTLPRTIILCNCLAVNLGYMKQPVYTYKYVYNMDIYIYLFTLLGHIGDDYKNNVFERCHH